jgi:hypothetical protein
MMKLRFGASGRRQRGQSIAEFALILPVLAAMLAATLEFGLAFDADMALETASREGARVAGALGNNGTGGCGNATNDALAEATVDPAVVGAVQTSLTGSGVDLTSVNIWIFQADPNGQPLVTAGLTHVNKFAWVWNADGITGNFVKKSGDYKACGRHDGTFGLGVYDDVAVSIQYMYTSKTGLLAIFSGGLSMSASAVMPIGPPWRIP